jgi:hypothetical protein
MITESAQPTLEPVIAYLQRLARSQMYGSLLLKFEHGRIVHLRLETNMKPSDLLSHQSEEPNDPIRNS